MAFMHILAIVLVVKDVVSQSTEIHTSCSRQASVTLSCESGLKIKVLGAYAAVVDGLRSDNCTDLLPKCTLSLREHKEPSYAIVTQCDTRRSCRTNYTQWPIKCENVRLISNVFAVKHICLRDADFVIAQDNGKPFDAEFCPVNKVISVQSAVFGMKSTKPCDEDVSSKDPNYFQEIVEKCGNRRACVDLVAQPAQYENPPDCSGLASDYVAIKFSCEQSLTTAYRTKDTDSDLAHLNMIILVTATLLSGLALALFTTIIVKTVIRKRKARHQVDTTEIRTISEVDNQQNLAGQLTILRPRQSLPAAINDTGTGTIRPPYRRQDGARISDDFETASTTTRSASAYDIFEENAFYASETDNDLW